MLVLSRNLNQRVRIELPDGRCIWITVTEIQRGKIRLGFTAPNDVKFMREELIDKPERDK